MGGIASFCTRKLAQSLRRMDVPALVGPSGGSIASKFHLSFSVFD